MANDFLIGPRGPYSGTNTNNIGQWGAAIYLPNRKNPAVTIYNSGSATVYLDNQDPVGQASSGQPLSAGSSIGWDEGRALYATTDIGQISSVVVTENGGNIFDAGAIAAQILAQGLAQQIAANIAISGAPPIDKFTQVASTTFNGGTSVILDASSYQSLTVTLDQGVPPRVAVDVIVRWTDTAGNEYAADTFTFGSADNTLATPQHVAELPVRGPRAVVEFNPQAGSGGGFAAKIYGSYKALTRIKFNSEGTGSTDGSFSTTGGAGGVQGWNGTIPVSTTWLWQPDVIAGPARLSLRFSAVTSFTLSIRNPLLTNLVYESEQASATTLNETRHYDFAIPPAPLEIGLTSGAGSTIVFRATLVPANPYAN